MIYLQGIESECGNLASKLRHSWIKHLILERDPEAIAELKDGFETERNAFEKRIAGSGDFDAYIVQARTLLQNMVAGFSAIEIAKPAFEALPQETRELIFSILDNLYLENTKLGTYSLPLKSAIDGLEFEIERFRESWFADATQNTIRERFQRVQFQAKKLDEILNDLPKGIPLP